MADDLLSGFDEAHPEPGLPPQFLEDGLLEGYLASPPNEGEVREVRERSPHLDPANWAMPARPLPPAYKTFLARSNGGTFVTGDREFQMLKAEELREYLFLYEWPETMPGSVPFALDGGGGFYLFDMSEPADAAGEYPILWANGGSLTFDDTVYLGWSLADVLRDGRRPDVNRG